ncbi:S-layer family protein [Cyanobacteria bacterium FACHB-472]|nr:S-layer family protein [Cyanobacteria bacterium FACHB-472]
MSGWHLNIWVLMGSAVWGLGCFQPLAAQVVPDNTLPTGERSQITGNPNFQIDGGATRGGNLFHSFSEFSVPTGGSAYFNNAADVQNIFSRVTGGSISNIDGLIRANGTANLFLLNPNGIIFGRDASLNIGGSFVATTANALGFGNLGFFSASNPEAPSPLLTINPSALLFNQITTAPIQNNSMAPAGTTLAGAKAFGLRVADGRSLLLVGGNISMDGERLNVFGGGLNAFGGRVELGGLVSAGTVGLNVDGNNLSLSFPDSVERSDIFLSNRVLVNVMASDGGSIALNVRNLEMTGNSILVAGIDDGLGSDNSKAGNISVNATGAINLNNGSQIGNEVRPRANGQGGDVNISASTLRLEGGAQILTNTFGAGKGGSLSVDAQDVQLIGERSGLAAVTQPTIRQGFRVDAGGDAGDLTIKTNTLLVRDGARVSTSTNGAGKGGSLSIDAQDVQIIGINASGWFSISSGLFSSANPSSTGEAGDLTINTNTLLVRDGAEISASTSGAGKGGSLSIDAQDVQIIGESADAEDASGLSVRAWPGSTGDAGDLTINTNTFLVRDGAQISASTWGSGKGGFLSVDAQDVQIIGGSADGQYFSGLFTSAQPNTTGNAGDLTINTNTLLVRDGAVVTVGSLGTGTAGDLVVDANQIYLDNQGTIRANTSGGGGNINLRSPLIVLRNGSSITSNARGSNILGGNIDINTDNLVAVPKEDNNITANSQDFRGGNITVRASGIFGIDFREQLTPLSDITATGLTSGTVNLITPGIDPSRGLAELPTEVVDATDAITQGCPANEGNSFVVTGRGGLPPNPEQQLDDDAEWLDRRRLVVAQQTRHPTPNTPTAYIKKPTSHTPIIEATGWQMSPTGQVLLVAATPEPTVQHPLNQPVACPGR